MGPGKTNDAPRDSTLEQRASSEKRGSGNARWRLTYRQVAVLVGVFGALTIFGPLIGPVDLPILSYRGEIDFAYTNSSFAGISTASRAFLQNVGYPFPTVNFSSEPGTDSVWGFTIAANIPTAMEIENRSGVFARNFTRVSTIGIRNWDYFEAKESSYWLNVSASPDQVNLRIASASPFAWPSLTIASSAGRTSSGVYVFTTFRPITVSSRVALSAHNLSLQLATGELVNITGDAHVTFRSFELAYFWLSTQQHSFLLQPGTRLEFFWSGLTLYNASGYLEASNGDQRLFGNATVDTMSPPRSVELEVASRTDNYANLTLRLSLETTTVRVHDQRGETLVGQHNRDLIAIPGWPGNLPNILMVVGGTFGIIWLAWIARADD